MSAFDDLIDIYATFKAAVKQVDSLTVGDSQMVEIPGAEKLAALLLKKGSKRYRITGLELTREK